MILFFCCILTLAIETPFMALWGYRKMEDVLLIVCVNAATNLCLNMLLHIIPYSITLIYLLEILVVVAEYLIYAAAFGRKLRLFVVTLAANCLSYGIGTLIF